VVVGRGSCCVGCPWCWHPPRCDSRLSSCWRVVGVAVSAVCAPKVAVIVGAGAVVHFVVVVAGLVVVHAAVDALFILMMV